MAAPHRQATIISMAIVATGITVLLHEGVGHGVTSWVRGGVPTELTSNHLSSLQQDRWVETGGTPSTSPPSHWLFRPPMARAAVPPSATSDRTTSSTACRISQASVARRARLPRWESSCVLRRSSTMLWLDGMIPRPLPETTLVVPRQVGRSIAAADFGVTYIVVLGRGIEFAPCKPRRWGSGQYRPSGRSPYCMRNLELSRLVSNWRD